VTYESLHNYVTDLFMLIIFLKIYFIQILYSFKRYSTVFRRRFLINNNLHLIVPVEYKLFKYVFSLKISELFQKVAPRPNKLIQLLLHI